MRALSSSWIAAGFFMLAIPGILLAGGAHAGAWSFPGSGGMFSCSREVSSSPESLLGEHYSPEEDLESIDVDLIDHARKSIEIAMYAFTDRPIAEALVRAASRGVRVFIYRDGIQIRDRGDKSRRILSSRAARSGLIQIEVKRNSSRNIMHLKAYAIDGTWLRTGSANWSPPGEGAYCTRGYRNHWNQQDNNLFITGNPREVLKFEETFRRIWTRGSNRPWSPN